jgi:hypothetical protein
MRFTKLFIALGVASMAAFGAAGDDAPLKLTALQNDVHNYTIAGQMSVGGAGDAKISGKMVQKVLKVEDNGNITYQETQNLTIEFGGQELPPQESVSVSVIKPDGTLVELRGSETSAMAYRMATISVVKLPDFALANDKTWTYDFPADSKTGVVKTKGDYKVLGSETLHGVDAWKLHMTVTEQEGDAPASTDGTVWLSKKDGSLVKMDGKVTNLPVPNAPGPVSGTQVVELATDAK